MTRPTITLIHKLDRMGYHILTYRQGTIYVAGIGVRDMQWAQRVVKGGKA
jgi:hypothetical protein